MLTATGSITSPKKSGERYPVIDCKAEKLFGYYEIYGYMHKLQFKYQNCICPFIISKFRELQKSLDEMN